jgi:multiple sugar transport system permease protein
MKARGAKPAGAAHMARPVNGPQTMALAAQPRPWYRTREGMTIIKNAVIYVLLVGLSIVLLIPFLWQATSSVKSSSQIFLFPPQWIPHPWLWSNYYHAFTALPFNIYFRNTMIVEVGCIVGLLLSVTPAAYGFARLRAPGKDVLFAILLSTMMLPYVVTVVPTYIIFAKLGWVNTLLPLIVPSFFGSAYFIFLVRQFFLGIPTEMEEAARIDGANTWQILWRIFMPLSKSALATMVIFTFIDKWHDFLGPLIYLNDSGLYTLALGINFFVGQYATDWNYLMAASTALIVPPLLVFYFAQRFFIEGIQLGGVKG